MYLNLSGLAGPSAYIYVRHSQSTRIGRCRSGHVALWTGYSLLHTEDEGRAHVQDLGNATPFFKNGSHVALT